jgi:hypothetical protein
MAIAPVFRVDLGYFNPFFINLLHCESSPAAGPDVFHDYGNIISA